jgi:hypothetical protein
MRLEKLDNIYHRTSSSNQTTWLQQHGAAEFFKQIFHDLLVKQRCMLEGRTVKITELLKDSNWQSGKKRSCDSFGKALGVIVD